jgi:hypothetical protein
VGQNGTQSGPPHPEDTDIHQFWPREDKSEAPDESSSTTPPSGSGGAKPGVAASVWNWVKNAASSVWSWIKGAATSIGNAAKQAASSAWNWTKQAAATAWNWARHAATSAWNWTKEAVPAAWTRTKQAVSSAWNTTKTAAETAWNTTKSAVRAAGRWIRGAAAAAGTWLKNTASSVWDSTVFRIIAHLTWGALGTAIGALVTAVNLTVGNAVTAVHNLVADAAHQWDYATMNVGGPNGNLPIIGNYGGLFNLSSFEEAVTIGPFVFFGGSGADARAAGRSDVKDLYANETPWNPYATQQALLTAQHEKGHTDQNMLYGPLAPIFGVVFSLLPNALGKSQTSWWFWFDRQANKWSGKNNPFNPNTHVHPQNAIETINHQGRERSKWRFTSSLG